MTKILMYEGNSTRVSRTYSTLTTLTAYDVTFTLKDSLSSTTKLVEVTGETTATGVIFNIPATTLDDGIYYFEITGETATQKTTLEQDRLLIKESIVYIT